MFAPVSTSIALGLAVLTIVVRRGVRGSIPWRSVALAVLCVGAMASVARHIALVGGPLDGSLDTVCALAAACLSTAAGVAYTITVLHRRHRAEPEAARPARWGWMTLALGLVTVGVASWIGRHRIDPRLVGCRTASLTGAHATVSLDSGPFHARGLRAEQGTESRPPACAVDVSHDERGIGTVAAAAGQLSGTVFCRPTDIVLCSIDDDGLCLVDTRPESLARGSTSALRLSTNGSRPTGLSPAANATLFAPPPEYVACAALGALVGLVSLVRTRKRRREASPAPAHPYRTTTSARFVEALAGGTTMPTLCAVGLVLEAPVAVTLLGSFG